MGFSYVDLDDIEPSGPGDAVRFVRRELGATAFGINHFTLPPGSVGREHDHGDSGQEEAMLVLAGSGTTATRSSCGRVGSCESTRMPVAGAEGITFVTIGSPREAPYVPFGPF